MTIESVGTNECGSHEQINRLNFDYVQCLSNQPQGTDVQTKSVQNSGTDWLPQMFFSDDNGPSMISASMESTQDQAKATTKTSTEQPANSAESPVSQQPQATESATTTKASESQTANQAQESPTPAAEGTKHVEAPRPAETSTPEARLYKQIYEGMTTGNMSFDEQLRLTKEYLSKYGQSDMGENRYEVRFLRQWQTEQENRKFVQIDLRDCVQKHHVPSNNEVGLKIAQSLGFSKEDIMLYATLRGIKDPSKYGEAFYKCDQGNNKYWLDRAAQDVNGGFVRVPELNKDAIDGMKHWLHDHHKNPEVNMERAKLEWYEEIFKHVYNPTANLVGGAMQSLGDIIQGLGLPAHLVTDKTFMDGFAKYLREKGQGLPMMDLYTKEELSDGLVCLANIYGTAGGAAITYMTPGFAGNLLKLTPRAAMLVSELAGAAGNAGNVYDTSMTRQATALAMREMEAGKFDPNTLQHRIEEIKNGKNVNPNDRAIMERSALLSAAYASGAGAVQGRVLGQLSQQLAHGVPVEKLDGNLIGQLAISMGKGGSLSLFGLSANELAMVAGNVQTLREAKDNISQNAENTFLGGAMVFGTAEYISRVNTQLRQLDHDGINHATDKTVNAVNENLKHVGGNGTEPLSPEALKRVKDQVSEAAKGKEGVTQKTVEEALKNEVNDPTLRATMARQIIEGLDATSRNTVQGTETFSARDTIAHAEVTNEICEPRFTHINSDGGGLNCTACVGAFFRSLREGKVVSTEDVYRVGEAHNNALGQPYKGRFSRESDAIDYIRQAAGLSRSDINIDRPVRLGGPDQAPSLSKLPAGQYAVTLDIKPGTAGERHVIYAQKTADGAVYFYDPQSGKAYSPELVKKVMQEHKPAFYEVKGTAGENTLAGLDKARIAPETYQAWNPEQTQPQTTAKPRESQPPVLTISKDQWNNYSPETRQFVEDTFARGRNDSFARKPNAEEIARMAKMYEVNKDRMPDAKLRVAIWKELALTTPPKIVATSGPLRPPVAAK